jgi:hypothetical protein
MTRKLMLPLLAAAGTLAVGAPAANASSLGSKVGQLSGKVAGLSKAVSGLMDTDKGQNASIDRVNNRVDTVVKNVAGVLAAVPAVQDALTNPVTGLVGLNNARPKFVNFTITNTNVEPHNGAVINGSTPGFKSVTYTGTDSTGAQTYILDFGQDITKRVGITSVATPDLSGADDATITPCGVSSATINACNGVSPNSASASTALFTSGGTANPNGGLSGKLAFNVVFLAG